MAAGLFIRSFLFLCLFAVGSHAQALLQVLRQGGFTEWASVLESARGAKILGYPGNLIIYAPTNAGLARQELSSGNAIQRRFDLENIWPEYGAIPWSGNFGSYKRSGSTCSQDLPGPGAQDLMTLLNDPEFVNLPAGQNASIVQKNMAKGTLPIVLTGLGDSVRVVGQDIPFDKGVIRPISSWFTLPRPISVTLPFIGANKVLGVLERTGLIDEFDNRTGITFLAPSDLSIPADLSDDTLVQILQRHVIVGLPKFTSDISHGDSFDTLAGTRVSVTIQCGEVYLDGARILSGDTIVKNGVVHMVDKLLEAPQIATTTLFQTVTVTATETTTKTTVQVDHEVVTATETVEVPVADPTTTTEIVTTSVGGTTQTVEVPVPNTTTTTKTVTVNQPATHTVEVTVPNTITTTETVTVNIPPSSPPSPVSSSAAPPPPPPVSSRISSLPPPPISSSTVPPPPSTSKPPSISPSTSSTPPPSSSTSESTPCPESSTTSSIVPPSSSPRESNTTPCPESSTSPSLPPSSSSAPESTSTPCPESSTTSEPPAYPTYPVSESSSEIPPVYPTYPVYEPSSSSEPAGPSSTPCPESSSPPPAYPTTLVTSQRPSSSAVVASPAPSQYPPIEYPVEAP